MAAASTPDASSTTRRRSGSVDLGPLSKPVDARGIGTADARVGCQCRAVGGLGSQDAAWLENRPEVGIWGTTPDDAAAHRAAMRCVPLGSCRAP
jgi:hypothetical protein